MQLAKMHIHQRTKTVVVTMVPYKLQYASSWTTYHTTVELLRQKLKILRPTFSRRYVFRNGGAHHRADGRRKRRAEHLMFAQFASPRYEYQTHGFNIVVSREYLVSRSAVPTCSVDSCCARYGTLE